MYQVIKTERRSNTNIEFATMASSFIDPSTRQYFHQTYKLTWKCLFVDIVISDNDLLYTSTMLWESEQDYNDFVNDPFLQTTFFDKVKQHMLENNIIYTMVSKQNI